MTFLKLLTMGIEIMVIRRNVLRFRKTKTVRIGWDRKSYDYADPCFFFLTMSAYFTNMKPTKNIITTTEEN